MILSRRHLGRLLTGAVFGQWILPSRAQAMHPFHVDRLLEGNPSEPVTEQYRQYRADAVVSLFSVTIFSRTGVGSGYASFRRGRRDGAVVTISRFGGGSFPARAHNLNRFGVIEEVVVEKESRPVEAAYFGFMTSSPEEGIGDARKSLDAGHD